MGFRRCVVPDANRAPADEPAGCDLIGVKTVTEALDELLIA